ncbi:MAG: hypothetical protein CM15mP54_27570 [Paracoccaceae bacterium]|nr:MAG: hypothetical protein CM15mP54_27570 [Paracoccaceae bacterium]
MQTPKFVDVSKHGAKGWENLLLKLPGFKSSEKKKQKNSAF